MCLAQLFGTILFVSQDLQLFQVTLPILVTFATWRDFWSVFPKVFSSCPNTLSLMSIAKIPQTSEGAESGQQ